MTPAQRKLGSTQREDVVSRILPRLPWSIISRSMGYTDMRETRHPRKGEVEGNGESNMDIYQANSLGSGCKRRSQDQVAWIAGIVSGICC